MAVPSLSSSLTRSGITPHRRLPDPGARSGRCAALCGGDGAFLAWLTLATAYRDADLAETIYDGGLTEEVPVRPVLRIP